MDDLRVSFPKPCPEQWDAMRPHGCDRVCERCDKVIHDLAHLTLEEAERLVRSGVRTCVRAQVGPGGVVKLRGSEKSRARRMVAVIGASVGILAASSQATATERPKLGAIKGAVLGNCGSGSVSATAPDGTVYHAKIGINGRYKVKRLPAGSYQVKVEGYVPPPDAGAKPEGAIVPTVHQVAVQPGRTSVLDFPDPNKCIIIGMLQLEGSTGHSDA